MHFRKTGTKINFSHVTKLVLLTLTATLTTLSSAQNIDLAALTSDTGAVYTGNSPGSAGDILGSTAGDMNGDGYDDFIIGSPNTGEPGTGEAFVAFGSGAGLSDTDFSTFATDNTRGFKITTTIRGSILGITVSNLGDFNGDGYDDVVIGTWNGNCYVVFGSGTGLSNLDVSSLSTSNARGFRIQGTWTSMTVSDAGDVNNDGYDDLLFGLSTNEAYVIFGKANNSNLDLASFTTSDTNGFKMGGQSWYGAHVDAAGDFNGDGFDDVLFGMQEGKPYGTPDTAGYQLAAGYLVYGKASGISDISFGGSTPPAGCMVLNADGTAIGPGSRQGGIPQAIAPAGDFNGDGYSDIILGAAKETISGRTTTRGYTYTQYPGAAYVVFGQPQTINTIALADLAQPGPSGFRIIGDTADRIGDRVSTAGDINGDGFSELMFTSERPYEDRPGDHTVFLVYGNINHPQTVDLANFTTGTHGFQIGGEPNPGPYLPIPAAPGDVNGDNLDDMLIITDQSSGPSSAIGINYLIYGNQNGGPASAELWNLY